MSQRKALQKREAERAQAHADRRACFSGSRPSRSVPRDIQALAHEIEAAQYNCSPRSLRELERARAMLAKGVPSGVLTGRDGFSQAPVSTGQLNRAETFGL